MKRKFLFIAMAAVCVVAMAQSPAVNGDVNGDGVVTAADITSIYNYLLNGDQTLPVNRLDVNGDGYVTSSDITAVYDVLLGNYQPPVEHPYIDLGLPSGTLWATTNVGASVPEEYGDYFAWGETSPKDVYNWSTYKWCMGSDDTMTKYCTNSSYGYNGFTDGKTELDPEDDAATANWGAMWRMPSLEQIQELLNNCTTQWTTRNGVNGRLFTSNINGASLFLPAAGYRWDSSLNGVGSWGYYWFRTLFGSPNGAGSLYFFSYGVDWNYGSRYDGFAVRAVRVSQN